MSNLPIVTGDNTLENSFLGETFQLSLITRDYRKMMEKLVKTGIGPWSVYTFGPDTVTDCIYRGQPGTYICKVCLALSGTMMWEIIQPLSGPSIYEEFLDKHGEGIHHVAVNCNDQDWETRVAEFEKHGYKIVQSGYWLGKVPFAYLEMEDDTAIAFEIFIMPEDFEMPEPDEWYPASPPLAK